MSVSLTSLENFDSLSDHELLSLVHCREDEEPEAGGV